VETIRVGFVGLGGICRSRHVPGLQKIAAVKLAAVCNRTRESGERAAREFDIPEVCATWQALVEHPGLDAVVIGTWPYLHRPVALAALDAGKHVFCQARMAMDYAEAKEMHDRAQKTGRVAMLCPVPIGLSIDATIARLLREGYFGDVRLVRVQSFSDAYASPDAPLNWRKDHRLSGLNVLTLGMYAEVVHRWFGWTRTVSAHTDTFVTERTDPAGERVPVRIPDQVLMNTTLAAGFPVQYAINAAVHHGADAVEVYGSEATLHYDVAQDILTGARAGESSFEPIPIAPEDAYDVDNWRVEQDFFDAIREGKEYHPNFEDGMRYMQVTQAAYDSAEQGAAIALD